MGSLEELLSGSVCTRSVPIKSAWCLAFVTSKNEQRLVKQAGDNHYFICASLLLRLFHEGHCEVLAPRADTRPSAFQLISQ